MRRTDLSRPSFYVYFRDRHQLVLKLVEHLGTELFAMSDRWLRGTGEGPELARSALDGIVAVYVEHGPVMRALADAAVDDPGVEQAYTALVESFIDATSRHIDSEIASGRILKLEPYETAKALVWMMERYLTLSLGREPMTPAKTVADTLATIWNRVLYGRSETPLAG
jgi:TetR/AcrR family transcriptional regulator, ethionamide resistance regulator